MENSKYKQFITRWLFSTNCKDIAVLYMIFAIFSGLIGTGLSLIIRLELAGPTPQILQNNGQIFNVVISAHAIFMIFFLVMPMAVGFFGNNQISLINNDLKFNNDSIINNKNNVLNNLEFFNQNINYEYFRPYLAGLIEGDGTIWVGEDKYKNVIPKISIVFNIKDKPLADYLLNITKCGTINKKKSGNYILWDIQNFREVYYILYLINGYMRTPKHEALIRAITWYNNYIYKYNNLNINEKLKGWDIINIPKSIKLIKDLELFEILDKDTSPLDSNAWLSGMTDADGNFSIYLYKKKKVNLYYRLELKQNNHRPISKFNNYINMLNDIINKGQSYYFIMSSIATLFNTNLYSRDRYIRLKDIYKIYSTYIVMVTKKDSLKSVVKYFDTYPLLSSKYLDYKDWAHLINMIESKDDMSKIYKLAEEIKTNYNSTRHKLKWDHLNLLNE